MRRIFVSGAAILTVVSALVVAGGLARSEMSTGWADQAALRERTTVELTAPTDPAATPAPPAAAPVGPGAGSDRATATTTEHRHDGLVHDEVMAARDKVAETLRHQLADDFVIDIDPGSHRLTVVMEAVDPGGDGIRNKVLDAIAATIDADEDVDHAPNTGDTGDADNRVDADGAGAGDSAVEAVELLAARDIAIEPLSDSPTAFPPYELGLHLNVGSGTQSAQCTAGYVFADASATYGSTAGHCGQVGDAVAVGPTLIDTIAINPFQPSREVRADAALYSLSRGGWSHRPVLHEAEDHAVVVGHLTDAEITRGLELCFSGRTTTERSCGAVNAAHRVICCDANDKSSVFSCIDRLARAGDSGAPVFRPLDAGRVIAAGLLSSSVTIDGRSSMCFSTIDNIQSETGTTIVTAPGPPPQPAPAPQQPEPPAPATNQPAAPPDQPPPPTEQPASAAEPSGAMSEPSLPPAQNEGTTTLEKALGALLGQ